MAGALACITYVAAATAAFGFVRVIHGTEGVRFVDILLPSRWSIYRVARGEQQLAEAKRFVDRQMFREGILFARVGLARAPTNRDGRLLLFELLLVAQRPDDARRVLLEGLSHHAADPVFWKTLLTFLLQRQEDAHVVALAQRFLAEAAPDAEPARLLALGGATAAFFRGNYDRAEDFLRAVPRLAASRDGRLLSAKIEWERGFRELALLHLRHLAAEASQDAEVRRELVSHLRRHGLPDEARRNSIEFQVAFPLLPGARVELLHAYRQAGESDRVAREVDSLLRDFPADSAALLALADFASEGGDVALVRRIARQAAEQGLKLDALALLTVESMVVARDFQGALEATRGFLADFPAWRVRYRGVFDSLQAAASVGLGDNSAAAMYLGSFLGQANLRANNLLAVASRLTDLGAGEQARRTLVRAFEIDPMNQAALTRLVELDIIMNATDDLAAHIQKLVRMRRPSPDILRVAQLKLGSDRFLFSPAGQRALEAVREALARRPPEAGGP